MFDFRIIEQADGTQIIDTTVKTPMEALTPEKQIEYMEVSKQLTYSEIVQKKERRKQREAEQKQKIKRNPLYKMACLCGLI